MDASETLRMIATLSRRLERAERIVAKYEQELSAARQETAQSRSDLGEMIKLAELLYETNQRMGAVMDFHREQQNFKEGDQETKSFDEMFNLVVAQAEGQVKTERGGADVAGGNASAVRADSANPSTSN
ncbi:uncharacterized protein N7484_008189 [Penicillium longicatenatum]|uniref:uncharacterized protein n=1 Tax=Penicillium longicatenatum TaxID=1561947 RepID=UPI002547D97D|nr:uncharacterized protein N7484_008189 [Penicillium longicatenatum]KAJ5640327.1 hypothetical protein N7484_008189 [Penicillium longicatenatum]